MKLKHDRGGIAVIFWGPHNRHAEQDSERLNARLYFIHYLGWRKGRIVAFIKYVPQCLKTWLVLFQKKPSAVYVFISPVFAALSVYIYCRLAGIPYIMDVHNHSLYSRKWKWSIPLVRALAKRALVNVVDQFRNKQWFESWGAKALVLERPLMTIPEERLNCGEEFNQFKVTVVNTFSRDEPLEPIFGAAEQLPELVFYILGDTARADQTLLKTAPKNVVFTGYLYGDDYWNQLCSSQAVIALTTEAYSLMSAATEALTLDKPIILSRQPALTEYFTKGVIFVNHTTESVVDGINKLQEHRCRLSQEIAELNLEKQQRWEIVFQELLALIRGEPCKEVS